MAEINTKFQRQMIRRLVGISDGLNDRRRALTDRLLRHENGAREAVGLQMDLRDARFAYQTALATAQRVRNYANHSAVLLEGERQSYLAEANQIEQAALDAVREIEVAIASVEAQLAALQPDVAAAGRVAEVMLKHMGFDRHTLAPALSNPAMAVAIRMEEVKSTAAKAEAQTIAAHASMGGAR